MKAHLMYRDGDFDAARPLPWNEAALAQDLELDTLLGAMAGRDEFFLAVAKQALLSGPGEDLETVLYRQAVLQDCLSNQTVVQKIYDLAMEVIEGKRKHWLGVFGHYPSSILGGSLQLLEMFVEILRQLRLLAEENAHQFQSEGFSTFFKLLRAELSDEYLAHVKEHLQELTFRRGTLVSAQLGKGNKGSEYMLRKPIGSLPNWFQRVFGPRPPGYTFYIAERDEVGARALSELRDRGINLVANATAQSADHILSFFVMLRTELAFYLGCVNLHRELEQKGAPLCFPVPSPPGIYTFECNDLRDACLVLRTERTVVGNDLAAREKNLFVITGANQGGKSTLLRSIGVAQLMIQCGMFVSARSFNADLCGSLLTHYKREEDSSMEKGKFDEELDRMNGIIDALAPDAMLLFNESFASTNEREGSEVARQIIRALLETRVKIFFVTHLYDFASGLWGDGMENAIFLRAERQEGGRRTFKLRVGEPLETSFGADLYKRIFENAGEGAGT